MSKAKIVIDQRPGVSKEPVRSMSVEEIIENAGADWDINDPGVGRAVLLPDGREVFNPVPMAPPVGYVEGPSIFDQLYAKLRAELFREKEGDEVVDTAEDMTDYPEDDEPTFWTDYELVLRDEFPDMPPPLPGSPGAAEDPPSVSQADPVPADPPPPKKKPAKPAKEVSEEA